MFVKHEYVHLEFHVLFYVTCSQASSKFLNAISFYIDMLFLRDSTFYGEKINLTCHVLEIVKVIGIRQGEMEELSTDVVKKIFKIVLRQEL